LLRRDGRMQDRGEMAAAGTKVLPMDDGFKACGAPFFAGHIVAAAQNCALGHYPFPACRGKVAPDLTLKVSQDKILIIGFPGLSK